MKFRLLREAEWCCGASVWRMGDYESAEKLVRRNTELFRSLGVKTVITACAECFGAFRSGYPRFVKPEFRALHITQVAETLLKEGKITFRSSGKEETVTYHDPCMLGRLSEEYVPWHGEIRSYGLHVPEKQWRRGEFGVYEAPRMLLGAIPGLKLTEMVRNREEAWCCGAESADTELAAFAADERRREAEYAGAEAIVSCCPFCREALDRNDGRNLKYYDMTELMADRLAGEGAL